MLLIILNGWKIKLLMNNIMNNYNNYNCNDNPYRMIIEEEFNKINLNEKYT